jgi:hypothetical protein
VGSDSICLVPLASLGRIGPQAIPLPTSSCTLPLPPATGQQTSQPTDIARLKFNEDGNLLIAMAWDGRAAFWRRGERWSRRSLVIPKEHTPSPSAIRLSPADRYAIFLVRNNDNEGRLALCDLRVQNRDPIPCSIVTEKHGSRGVGGADAQVLNFTGVVFLANTSELRPEVVMSLTDGRLCAGHLIPAQSTLQVKSCMDIPSGLGELAISPDDSRIGLAGTDGNLYLWERRGRLRLPWDWNRFPYRPAKVKPITVSAGPLSRLSFSPREDAANAMMSVVSLDGTASLWNLNGQQMASFKNDSGAQGGYLSADFSHQGQLLLWQLNGAVRQVPVQDLSALIRRGCQQVEVYRKGALTPEEEKKKVGFCRELVGSSASARRS